MTESLHVTIDSNVAIVRLNRPDKNNAIDLEMFEAFIATGQSLSANRKVRAVVLHGAGDNFCAGIDLSAFQGSGIGAAGQGRMDPLDGSLANFFQSAAYVWRDMPVPVIAAIRGFAFGGGLQIALGADIRYAAADARFSIMEVKWGLIPDMGISQTALHVVAADKLKELAFTGRVIDGNEAASLGVITAIKDDPLHSALEIAEQIAGRSPDAIRATKVLINESWQINPAESLRREAELQIKVMRGKNQKEAVAANFEKRAPDFCDAES